MEVYFVGFGFEDIDIRDVVIFYLPLCQLTYPLLWAKGSEFLQLFADVVARVQVAISSSVSFPEWGRDSEYEASISGSVSIPEWGRDSEYEAFTNS